MLLPVLDESKHYWQGADEVDKLLRSGGDWLATHPERELITRRYLGRAPALTRVALARLAELGDEVEDAIEPAEDEEVAQPEEQRVPLNAQRRDAVLAALGRAAGARSVIDLGCGQGQLLDRAARRTRRTPGSPASTSPAHALRRPARRLRVDDMGERQRRPARRSSRAR